MCCVITLKSNEDDEPYDSFLQVNKSRRINQTWHVARIGDRRVANSDLVEKSERNRSLVISRRRWENNIKMDLQELGFGRGLD